MDRLQFFAQARDTVSLLARLSVSIAAVACATRTGVIDIRKRWLEGRAASAVAHRFGHACTTGDCKSRGKVRGQKI
jgi:hypothetical protein